MWVDIWRLLVTVSMQEVKSEKVWGILKKRMNVLSSILQYLPEVVRAYHETKAKIFNLFFFWLGTLWVWQQKITAKKANIESLFSGNFTVFPPSLYLELIYSWIRVLFHCFTLENGALSIHRLWRTNIYWGAVAMYFIG